MQLKGIRVELATIDQLDTELKANRGELSQVLSQYKTLVSKIADLRDSYGYLSGQYSTMKNKAMDLGDSKITERIVKALNESNSSYKQVNDIFQKIK